MNGKEALEEYDWMIDKDGVEHEFIDALELEDFIEREIEILRGRLIVEENREFAEGIRDTISGLCNALFWKSILRIDGKEYAEEVFNDIYRKKK